MRRPLRIAASFATLLLTTGPVAAADFLFVIDGDPVGKEYVLDGFDAVSLLSGTNRQGTFTALYDRNTIFRDAKLARFTPTDPCRDAAADYNTGGQTGDQSRLNAALTVFATLGCHARVLINSKTGTIGSFRPAPTF